MYEYSQEQRENFNALHASFLERLQAQRVAMSQLGNLQANRTVKLLLQYGIVRRLIVIERAFSSIFRTFSVDREPALSLEQAADLTMYLQAFHVNVLGLLANVSAIYVAKAGLNVDTIDLFGSEALACLPGAIQEAMRSDDAVKWLEEAKANERAQSRGFAIYVHRSQMTSQDVTLYNIGAVAQLQAIKNHEFELGEEIGGRIQNLGRAMPVFSFSEEIGDDSESRWLHPSVLNDVEAVTSVLDLLEADLRPDENTQP